MPTFTSGLASIFLKIDNFPSTAASIRAVNPSFVALFTSIFIFGASRRASAIASCLEVMATIKGVRPSCDDCRLTSVDEESRSALTIARSPYFVEKDSAASPALSCRLALMPGACSRSRAAVFGSLLRAAQKRAPRPFSSGRLTSMPFAVSNAFKVGWLRRIAATKNADSPALSCKLTSSFASCSSASRISNLGRGSRTVKSSTLRPSSSIKSRPSPFMQDSKALTMCLCPRVAATMSAVRFASFCKKRSMPDVAISSCTTSRWPFPAA
mmetsp:Transcript_47538/g.101706  ORF Transcript_47538/g.101706 Transcript_47538/m.101706 type:complete len:269 (+) Transcript_47538:858-1664(+)